MASKHWRVLLRWVRQVATPQPHRPRWQDRVMTGHLRWGPVIVYGANAMHWAVNIWWLGHYWCFHPTTRTFGGYWPWYFYISRDATPQSACYRAGRDPE